MARPQKLVIQLGTHGGASSSTFSNGTSIGATQIAYGDSTGKIKGAAGLVIVGTPSATAPSTGTNGPGLQNGIQLAAPDGASFGMITASYGNTVAQTSSHIGYACQGTAASPGATIALDGVGLELRGYDGTAFTPTAAAIRLRSGSTWTASNRETYIQFDVTPNGSTSGSTAGRIDGTGTYVCGASASSSATFSGGTIRPRIQASNNNNAIGGMASVGWNNGAGGPLQILAHSRSGTVGTQGVITTGDTLGTLSFQGDDGTNFVAAAQIAVTATGTIASTRVPGNLVISTGTDAAPTVMTAAITINNTQQVTFNTGAVTVSNSTASTSGATGALIVTSGGIGSGGAHWSSYAPAAATSPAFGASGTSALAGGVTDAYTSSVRLTPAYSGVQTVTRHNYIDLNQPSLSSTTLTDAAVFRFDAAIGTHKAVDTGTTKTSPGTVTAWVKVNINGTLHFMPAYSSKTT